MRLTRAFWASAGAGLSIVAAAVSALFVLSAVVAVKGWPGIDPDNDVPSLVLSEAVSAGAAGGALATAATVPGAAGAAGAGDGPAAIVLGGGDASRGGVGARRGDGPSARVPGRAPGGTSVAGGRPSSGAGGGGGGQAGGAPSATGGAPPPIGDTVDGVTGSSPVTAVTDTAAGVVEGGGQVIDGATQNVAPPVGDAVESVTGGAGDAVRDAGSAVDSVTQGDAVGSLLGG